MQSPAKLLLANAWQAIIAAFLISVVAATLLVLYRLALSPIARFPGPKIAAATGLYEFFHGVIRDGAWGKEVERMHHQYGPIVRINPWELSIRDPEFYSQLYVVSSVRKTNMWARGRQGNGFEGSHHLSVEHDLHRHRRRHIEEVFTKSSIERAQEVVVRESELLIERLLALRGKQNVVNLDHAFTALTGDIIGQVGCGSRLGLLDDEDFSPQWHKVLIQAVMIAPFFKSFPWLSRLLKLVPASTLEKIYPSGVSSRIMGDTGAAYIDNIKKDLRDNASKEGSLAQKSVFHHLLSSPIPEPEKSKERLQAEAMVLLIAGSVTSAHTLSLIVYYALSQPKILESLREELKIAMPAPSFAVPSWTKLEKLPYLRSCIKEALRLNALIGNLVRISPDISLQYKQWTIPPNTPVGMSIYHMHTNTEVWEQPLQYLPQRWMVSDTSVLERNFVPFTKGSRNCLGMNLAMAELYIATAMVFGPRGPQLQLFETDATSVDFVRDFVMGFPVPSSKGVRVIVKD